MPISYTRRSPVLLLDTLQRNCASASSYLGLDPLSAVDLVEAEDLVAIGEDLVVDSVAEDLVED